MMARMLDTATRLGFYLGGAAFALIILCYVAEVMLRYFFNAPTSVTSDAVQGLFAVMVMLGIPEVSRNNGHVVIGFFLEKMDPGRRAMLFRLLAALGFLICAAMVWICLAETLRQYRAGILTEWNHPVPKYWISGIIPYGIGVTGLHFLRMAVKR